MTNPKKSDQWTAPEHYKGSQGMKRINGTLYVDARPEIMRPKKEPKRVSL